MTSTDPATPPPAAIVLDHVTVAVSDLGRSQAFYDAALGALGVQRVVDYLDPEDEDEVGPEALGYGGPDQRVVLWLVVAGEVTRGLHLAFRASDQTGVRTFFTEACAHGGAAHTSPRAWQLYRPGRYSASVADPDGNLVEAVYEPGSTARTQSTSTST